MSSTEKLKTSSTERSKKLRAKRLAAGLSELRGIWLPKSAHKVARKLIKDIIQSPSDS